MKNLSGPISLIKQSINLFFKKENLVYFLKIYAVLVPFAIFFYSENKFLNFNTTNISVNDVTQFLAQFGWLIGISIPIGLAYLIISFWVNASGIKAVINVAEHQNLNIKGTFQFAWKKLWLFSVLSVVVAIIVGFGFILLFIPGIIFLVWFHFSGFEFMKKEVGIGTALGGSKRLVSGKFFPVLGRFVVFGIFGILVQIIFDVIPLGLGSIIQPLFGALFILPYFLLYRELMAG